MPSSDGARWDPQSQRWEWGPAPAAAPAPDPGPAAGSPAAPDRAAGPPQPPAQPPVQPQPPMPPQLPTLPLTPPGPNGSGYHEPWPPVPPPPPPPPGAGQWRAPVLVGLAAAVAGGAAVAAWMLLGPDNGPATAARPPASPSSGQPTGPAPEPPVDPSSPGTGTPSTPAGTGSAGYTVVRNDDGFSVAVPAGWEPSHNETGSGAFYRPPGDRSALLQIFRVTESGSTGSCTLLQMSSDRLRDGTPGYRQVSLEPASGTGCELVYEYDSAESHGRRRGMERIITTPDGKRWALLAAGPSGESTTTRANLTAALDSFRPD